MGKRKTKRFVISKLYLTLFLGYVTAALFTMAIAQRGLDEAYRIASFQLIFAMAGFTVILMSVMSREMIWDKKNIYEPRAMDTKRGWLLYGLVAMAVARILGGIIFMKFTGLSGWFGIKTNLSSVWFGNLVVVLTSAVFEETFFCATGLFFFIIFLKVSKGNEVLAIVLSTLVVSAMFAAIHLGVYSLDMGTVLYIAIARAVYNVAFLKTRSLLTSTTAHLFHNLLIMFGI